jgi:hypothetical protein
MNISRSSLVVLALLGFVVAGLRAQEKKETTLKGTILCAMCALKETSQCQTAIQVKEGNKLVTYYFLDKGDAESYHDAVCGGERKEGTVTGTLSTKDGKQYITPKKVEYAKK